MGVKNFISKIGSKAADVIAKSAVLSPLQLKDIEEKRTKYLDEMPNPDDEASIETTGRLLAACGVEIYNAYLNQISDLYRPIDSRIEYNGDFNTKQNIRFFNITKWVVDKKEQSIDKLVNVYEVLSKENCNIGLIFNRKKDVTKVYLAVVNLSNEPMDKRVEEYRDRLVNAIRGNFPGTERVDNNQCGNMPCFENRDYSVACISNVPAEKSEKYISQTIEKLLDGIAPKNTKEEYTLMLLATPVIDVGMRKLKLGEFYSALNPYAKWDTSYHVQESNQNSSTGTFGVNVGAGAGIQCGNTQSKMNSTSNTENESTANTENQSTTITNGETSGTNESHTEGKGGSQGINLILYNNSGNNNTADMTGTSHSINNSKAEMVGKAITKTLGKALTNTLANQQGTSTSKNFGINFGANFARSSTVTASIGKDEGINQTFINYNIKHTLDLLEEQMKRLEQSSALGMWDFAAYVLSEDRTIANNVAHSYLALTQGEKSYLSNAAINTWRGDQGDDSVDAKEICKYLSQLRHPMFALDNDKIDKDKTFYVYPTTIDATTSLSGKELAYSLNFPKKSVIGFPVIECAEFGRNISKYDEDKDNTKLCIGSIFHMQHDENIPVELSKESLALHTFITGSTGSGKSNTVYEILNEVVKNDVKFLVVEPTKGEYKNVFASGENPIAKVYGTNKELTPLLRLNPFVFPQKIHVFEHMDRLVEIFNVCWPMYAAMPAVLKNAIQKAYEDCGWDLIESTNSYGDLYPNFKDVMRNIKIIIETSEFDNENKGAYKGALLTRLESLTNGINSMIFTDKELTLNELFDDNVIIDISRIGSNETKSLIMGVLILKLQEYRMSMSTGMNSNLKHLTVLEEAHNILKRTSSEQHIESSNLIGKSVEMLSNAIAEMRTYGEGFIIVDQAPGLLDMAAIRNTNTKIIMRLPDEDDRKLVGKSANLNDDQILELAKLPKGVCAIYQNEWVQPILCKVKYYNTNNLLYDYTHDGIQTMVDRNDAIEIATMISKNERITEKKQLKDIQVRLDKLGISASNQVLIFSFLKDPTLKPRMTKLAPIMNALFPEITKSIEKTYNETNNRKEWTNAALNTLKQIVIREIDDRLRMDIIHATMTYYLYIVLNKEHTLKEWIKDIKKGGLK